MSLTMPAFTIATRRSSYDRSVSLNVWHDSTILYHTALRASTDFFVAVGSTSGLIIRPRYLAETYDTATTATLNLKMQSWHLVPMKPTTIAILRLTRFFPSPAGPTVPFATSVLKQLCLPHRRLRHRRHRWLQHPRIACHMRRHNSTQLGSLKLDRGQGSCASIACRSAPALHSGCHGFYGCTGSLVAATSAVDTWGSACSTARLVQDLLSCMTSKAPDQQLAFEPDVGSRSFRTSRYMSGRTILKGLGQLSGPCFCKRCDGQATFFLNSFCNCANLTVRTEGDFCPD